MKALGMFFLGVVTSGSKESFSRTAGFILIVCMCFWETWVVIHTNHMEDAAIFAGLAAGLYGIRVWGESKAASIVSPITRLPINTGGTKASEAYHINDT